MRQVDIQNNSSPGSRLGGEETLSFIEESSLPKRLQLS